MQQKTKTTEQVVEIREFDNCDIPQVVRLYNKMFGDGQQSIESTEELLQRSFKKGCISSTVAIGIEKDTRGKSRRKVVGMCIVLAAGQWYPEEVGMAEKCDFGCSSYLHTVAVDPEWHSAETIARKLYHRSRELAVQQGSQRIVTDVLNDENIAQGPTARQCPISEWKDELAGVPLQPEAGDAEEEKYVFRE